MKTIVPTAKGPARNINGGKYVGEWKDGKKHGEGVATYRGSPPKRGYWKKGKFWSINKPFNMELFDE